MQNAIFVQLRDQKHNLLLSFSKDISTTDSDNAHWKLFVSINADKIDRVHALYVLSKLCPQPRQLSLFDINHIYSRQPYYNAQKVCHMINIQPNLFAYLIKPQNEIYNYTPSTPSGERRLMKWELNHPRPDNIPRYLFSARFYVKVHRCYEVFCRYQSWYIDAINGLKISCHLPFSVIMKLFSYTFHFPLSKNPKNPTNANYNYQIYVYDIHKLITCHIHEDKMWYDFINKMKTQHRYRF